MKKIIISVLATILVFFGVGGLLIAVKEKQLGAAQSLVICQTAPSYSTSSNTSFHYLAAGAASGTLGAQGTSGSCFTERADMVDLNIALNSSSTATSLHWEYEFSDDNTVWYSEDTKTTLNNTRIEHGATTTHQWNPGAADLKFKNVTLTPVASKYFRIRYSLSGAAGGVFWKAILRERID